jgi:hypothetical protein
MYNQLKSDYCGVQCFSEVDEVLTPNDWWLYQLLIIGGNIQLCNSFNHLLLV